MRPFLSRASRRLALCTTLLSLSTACAGIDRAGSGDVPPSSDQAQDDARANDRDDEPHDRDGAAPEATNDDDAPLGGDGGNDESPDPVDASVTTDPDDELDAGSHDAGGPPHDAHDAGMHTDPLDAGHADPGPLDAGHADAGPVDAGPGDPPPPPPPPPPSCSKKTPGNCDFVVTTSTKTKDNPLFGSGFPVGYVINGEQGPTLQLEVGKSYTFLLSQPCSHPLYLSTSSSGAGAGEVTDGASYVGGACNGGVLTFTPSASTPEPLYYQCEVHAGMGGTIEVD